MIMVCNSNWQKYINYGSASNIIGYKGESNLKEKVKCPPEYKNSSGNI